LESIHYVPVHFRKHYKICCFQFLPPYD
jgi:hypothetical protein